MRPKLTLLSDEIIARILEEAYELLLNPGIKVQNEEARDLLARAGATVNPDTHVAQIPASMVFCPQGVVDIEVEHLAQVLHELVWQKEKICQTVGLLAEAGEIYGGHRSVRYKVSSVGRLGS